MHIQIIKLFNWTDSSQKPLLGLKYKWFRLMVWWWDPAWNKQRSLLSCFLHQVVTSGSPSSPFRSRWTTQVRHSEEGLPGGPVVENPPCNAGNAGLIPGQGTKIPHAMEQLSLPTTTRESVHHNKISHITQQGSLVLQLRPNTDK